MRKILLALLCLFVFSDSLFAQNKTLGVGVATPNPNAALHVESPTGNQGFLLPRLSTQQRLAATFTGVLGQPDNGLMVYDTDLKTIFIWNGISWQSTGEVAGGIKLTYPYVDSVTIATGTNDLFALKYYNAEPKRVMRIENQNPTNGSSTLSVYTAGTGLSGYFQVANAATTSSTLYATTNSNAGGQIAPVAVYGESTGTGSLGGSFRVNNAQNTFPALFAETTGTGVSIMAVTSTGFSAIQGEATGGFSNGVSGISNSPNAGSYAILGTNNGAGPAGVFNITDTTNSSRVVSATTRGQGPAGFFEQTSTTVWSPALMTRTDGQGAAFNATSSSANANAAEFVVQNITNRRNAVMASTLGMGNAGSFSIDNANNTTAAVLAKTNGPGAAIQAENTGAGNGFAGSFTLTDPLNGYPAIQASTAGNGSGVRVMQSTGNGPGMDVFMQNVNSPANGFNAEQRGLGSAATFTINNSGNTASGVVVSSNGQGDVGFFDLNNATSTNAAVKARVSNSGGVAGAFEIYNTSNTRDAIFSITQGLGSAGNFNVDNTSSTNSAIYASTNGTGTAIFANHTGSTGNLAIFQSNSTNVARIDKNGQGLFNGGTVNSGADVAEMFDVEGERNSYEPGDVLVISVDTDRTVEKSALPNSTKVAGVYATKPGVRLTERNLDENMDDLVPMGVIGVIPTKVCLENGPIKRGDLLVTSSKKGHAMKAIPANVNGILIYPTGAILGKALENFDGSESGLIKVLVNVK